jgi:hypothetical protein
MSVNDEREVPMHELFPDVQLSYLPSQRQYARWKDWVTWDDGCDEYGLWNGACPLHDQEKDKGVSATFQFHENCLRCQASPSCHHPKRAKSLDNVWATAGLDKTNAT